MSVSLLVSVLCGLWGGNAFIPVEGLKRTESFVLEPIFRSVNWEKCDSGCVSQISDKMEHLGIFSEIVVRFDSLGSPKWQVKELPILLPVPNGRLSDEEGVSWGAGVKSPNFLGKGMAFEALFLAGSSFEAQASLSGSQLFGNAIGWDFFFGRTDRFDNARNYNELSYRALSKLEWPSDQPFRWMGRFEGVHVHADRPGITYRTSGNDWLPAVMGGGIWDSRNRRGLTTQGIWSEVSIERIGGPLGGPADGYSEVVDFRIWHPIHPRWGIHFNHLLEMQQGMTGNWRTFVLGGANSVRGIASGSVIKSSEQLVSLEVRWLVVPMQSFQIVGQNLYGGIQMISGLDAASAWNEDWGERKMAGVFMGVDVLVPFVERVRAGFAVGTDGPKLQILAGLFEKSSAQRYRIR